MQMKLNTRKIFFAALALAAIALILRVPATAAAQDSNANTADPPGRVARLNLVQGSVSFQPSGGGDNDWVAAEVNRPLTTGDQLWSDTDGMVEMHVGSTAVRMGNNTGVSYLNLSDSVIQLQVSAGSVVVNLRELDPNDAFEVDTPNLAFSLLQPGVYEIDVDPDNDITSVTVVSGTGLVTGGGRSWNITPDQKATFTGSETLTYDLADADSLPQTSFENWSAERDSMESNVVSARYVSPETTGYEDLDTYGDWSQQPQYGPVWFPRGVEVGWAPYRLGHWVWIMPWGWTWIDTEPWGFAPFHYGRWAAFGGRWGWVPGPYDPRERPIYAPALVGWIGGTPGFSFSIVIGGGGGIGWFPLGPREVFMPTYRVSEDYVTRVNITNTFVDRNSVFDVYRNNARNISYANERVSGGVTVVSHDNFVRGADVSRIEVRVPDRDFASAPVNRGGPNAQPTRESDTGEARHSDARPPEKVINRPTVAMHTPPPGRENVRTENGGSNGGRGEGGYQPSDQNMRNSQGGAMNGPGYRPPNRNENNPPNEQGGQQSAPPQNGEGRGNEGYGANGSNNGRGSQPNNSPANEPNTPPANESGSGRNNNANNGRSNQPNSPPANQPNNPPPNEPGNGSNNNANGRNNPNAGNGGNNPPPPRQPEHEQPPQPAPQPPPTPPPTPQPSQPPRQNVRQAPPVTQPTQQEQQSDAAKQQAWQAQHQQAHQNDHGGSQPNGGSQASTPTRPSGGNPPSAGSQPNGGSQPSGGNQPSGGQTGGGKNDHSGGGQGSKPPKPPPQS